MPGQGQNGKNQLLHERCGSEIETSNPLAVPKRSAGDFLLFGLGRSEMKRIVKYDLLRVVSCFAIVLLHVSGSYWHAVDVESKDFATMTVYNSLTRFGVPVFFMLSGLFVLDPDKSFSVDKWVKKTVKLAACFFIWSFFYGFQSVLFHGVLSGWSSVGPEMWSSAVNRLVTGHAHMWYLLDLLGFYLILPILRDRKSVV